MRKIPREEFLPLSLREFAYEDSPLPIAEGQTISQPYIVALMADALLLRGAIVVAAGGFDVTSQEIAALRHEIERLERQYALDGAEGAAPGCSAKARTAWVRYQSTRQRDTVYRYL